MAMDENQVRTKLSEVLSLVTSDINSIRTGKATPSLVSDIQVSAYGGKQKLHINELATVTAPDAQTIVVDPFDKSIIGEIKKGIEAANIGLNSNIDGEIIRINVPTMTTEDREKYVKLLSSKIENGRVMVRQIRGEFMKDIKHAHEAKELTEDEKFGAEKRLQEVVDEYIEKIESAGEAKKTELLQI